METVVIVRDRYQITIPDLIRRGVSWLSPGKAVKLKQFNGSLIIQSYQEKKINWLSLRQEIKKLRELSGAKSLADFIVKDRERH